MISNKQVQKILGAFINLTEELEGLNVPQTQINKVIDEIIAQGVVSWTVKANSSFTITEDLKGKLYTSLGILNECRPFNTNFAILRANEILSKVSLQLVGYGSVVELDQLVVAESDSNCVYIKDLDNSKSIVELVCNFIYDTANY